MLPTQHEMAEALIARIGEETYAKFQSSTVAICGLGGLGSHIAISLARAGIGTLILIDFDEVDITNLNRQQYKVSQIGTPKPEALAANICEVNPYLNVITYTTSITEDNVKALVADADIICEAFDDAEQKSLLTDAVLTQLPHAILVAASGMAGLGDPNTIRTRKIMSRFYLCGDESSDIEEIGSLFAPRVALCAAHQATTVLRIIANT